MSKRMREKWLKVTIQIHDELPEKSLKACPVCGEIAVDYQYVGDNDSKIGYLCAWCSSCKNGIHISRVIIPENTPFISFDSPNDELLKRIPNFKQCY